MFTYQAKDEFFGVMFAVPKKNPAIPLYNKIRCVLSSICAIVEEWREENVALYNWASQVGNGSIYVILEVVEGDTGDMYEFKVRLIIESTSELPLNDHFVKVNEIDLDSYNQQFEIYARDATSDYSRSVNEFPIDGDSIIIMRYKLVSNQKPDMLDTSALYFSTNIYLCTRRPDI